MLRIMLTAIVALGAFLVFEARADASPYVQYGIQDDAWLLGGPGTFDERLDQVDSLGVDVVRVNLRWDEIAAKRPAKPASHLRVRFSQGGASRWLGGTRTPTPRGFFTLKARLPRGAAVQLWSRGMLGVPLRLR